MCIAVYQLSAILAASILLAGSAGSILAPEDDEDARVSGILSERDEGSDQVWAAAPGESPPMLFGMDAASIHEQAAAGASPDYGTIWVGPWNLQDGWAGTNDQLAEMRSVGVTPAIHLYYWGSDISQSCLENGCWSQIHQAHKDKAGWDDLTERLITRLDDALQGGPALIFLETEFNNGDVQTYEPLDRYLTEKADRIHRAYPNATVVLSIGNWNPEHWGTWDRAAAASDLIGIQGLRGSTRDNESEYRSLYDATLTGAKTARSLFGKPLIIQDIGLSSYPGAEYEALQAEGLQRFFDGMSALKSTGVRALLYREWSDDPTANLAEYYGPGERHWGVTDPTGEHKPAADVWISGVNAERSNSPGGSLGD